MQKKIILILSCCLLSFLQMMAQEGTSASDAVYMKNGSVFRGTIMDYIPGEQVQLQMTNGNMLLLDDKNVRKIIQGGADNKKNKVRKPYQFREKGVYHFTSGHINTGRSAYRNYNETGLGFTHTSGYQFNRWLGVGIGMGMDYYYMDSGQRFLQTFAEARGYLMQKRMSPYYALSVGYGSAFQDEDRNIIEAKGGALIYPAMGFRFGGSNGANFTLDFGVKFQSGTFVYRSWDVQTHEMNYNRAVIRIGLLY